tara:strand:- start:608 stop:919 length:312 start_codon:yes stop_codon:yes gene_type:complete
VGERNMSDMGDYRDEYFYGRTGQKIPNQIMRHYQNGSCVFYSYDTKIAEVDIEGDVTLFYCWNMYSQTTNKYLLKFMNKKTNHHVTSITQIRQLLKSNIFSVV